MPNHVLLIVEDDADVRDALSYLLHSEGYEAVCAADGQEALDALARGVRPCLILLDMMMPGLNGEDFRRIQLAHPIWREFPVALYTGDGHASEKARRLGVPLWFIKPLEVDELLHAVGAFCDRHTAADPPPQP